jgi:hypothetical protein
VNALELMVIGLSCCFTSNAIKFTSKGEVSIKVRLAPPPVGSTETRTCSTKEPVNQLKRASAETPAIEQDSNETVGACTKNDVKGDGDSSDISRSSSSVSSVSSLSSYSSISSTSSLLSTKTTDGAKGEEEEGAPGRPSTFPVVMWDLSPKSFEMTDEIWLHCEVADTGIGIPGMVVATLSVGCIWCSRCSLVRPSNVGLCDRNSSFFCCEQKLHFPLCSRSTLRPPPPLHESTVGRVLDSLYASNWYTLRP